MDTATVIFHGSAHQELGVRREGVQASRQRGVDEAITHRAPR
jgi:hypothetical protein